MDVVGKAKGLEQFHLWGQGHALGLEEFARTGMGGEDQAAAGFGQIRQHLDQTGELLRGIDVFLAMGADHVVGLGLQAQAGPRGQAELDKPVETRPGIPVRDILLVLRPPASLEGKVYAPDGTPGKDTPILLQLIREGGFLQKWSRTDREGRFYVPVMPPGTWQVITMGGGFMKNAFLMQTGIRKKGKLDLKGFMDQSRIGWIKLAPGEKGKITLGTPAGPSGTLEGLVTAGGKPLEGALVTAVPVRKDGKKLSPRMSSTGSDGRFRVEHLPQGKYMVLVMSKTIGGTQARRTVVIRPDETTSIRVAFGGGKVKGRLVPLGKCAGLGGRIVLLRKEGSAAPMGSGITNAKGEFEVDSLAPGTYRVYVRPLFKPAPGEPVGRSETFQVGEGGGPVEIQVPVQASVVIKGSLEGRTVKGVRVKAGVEGWPESFTSKAGEAGLFLLGGLPPGKTRVQAEAGKLKGSLEILTTPGETTQVVLHLK